MFDNNIWGEIFCRSGIDIISNKYKPIKSFAHNTRVNIYKKITSQNNSSIKNKLLICLPFLLLDYDYKNVFFEFIQSLAFYLRIPVDQMVLACNSIENYKNYKNYKTDLKDMGGFLDSSNKYILDSKVNLLDYINKNNLMVINLSVDIEFIEEKFSNRDYAYIRTLDLSSVFSKPLLKKQVFRDV